MLLAQAGYRVDAIDISREGLELARREAVNRDLDINWIEQDLDRAYRFDSGYDVILVTWYVNLELITRLCGCLAPGGYLLCEEHLVTEQDVIGPTSRDYRVAPGELRGTVSGVEILLYEEAVEAISDDESLASARMVVKRPA